MLLFFKEREKEISKVSGLSLPLDGGKKE